jgi:hypothetical protein
MGSTIGQVQEAIDTMGASGAPSANASPNLPKVAQLKDPQSPAAAVLADDDDDAPPSSIGIASDARARLAEQAKLANEERDRQQQRDSGAIADLVYSDESDDEDYSPTSPRRSLTNANGPNGHSHGAVGLGSSPLAHQDVATPVVSPTTATHATASNEATPKALSESVAASTTEPQAPAGEGLAAAPVTALAAQAAPTSPPTSPPAAAPAALTSAQEPAAPSSAPIVPAAAVVTRAAAAPAVAAVASTHSRSVSGASDALPRGAANPTSPATRTVETPGDATSVQSSSKRPAQWTVDEVVEWARSKGFDEAVCAKFIEHEISGDILLEMDANMLKEIDIPQFGKRVRISTAISELRRPSSALSSASPAPPEHGVLPGVVGGMRTFSAPPASYSSSSPVVDDASWGHGRKVSMTPSTPAIDEVPAGVNGSRSPSHPVSPAYAAAAGVAAGAAGAAAVSPLSKRDSSSSLGHKKKGSMDKTDRLSFFGRARKPAPMPGPQSHGHGGAAGAVRSAFGGKPTTTIAAAQPERRISGGGATVAIGSALRTIGSPDKSGYLKKRGDRYNTWKTRFFVLKGSHLYYLKSESEDRVKGRIDLKGHRIMFEGQQSAGGSYGFSLVGPNDKTHSFSAPEQSTIRDWMKALMKATIARDYTVPVTSSCNIPTIPLAEAQALQPRPPSPSQIDATQRANRRENVNQLTARDASVLVSKAECNERGRGPFD